MGNERAARGFGSDLAGADAVFPRSYELVVGAADATLYHRCNTERAARWVP